MVDMREENYSVEEKIHKEFDRERFGEESNRVWILAELLGVEESGRHEGIDKDIVLAKTSTEENKPLYVWVVFDQMEYMDQVVQETPYVYIEGYMDTCFKFNDKAVSHTFIVPETVEYVEKDIEVEKKDLFSLNYTRKNRVVLEGYVGCTPWKEYIPNTGGYVTRFTLKFMVNGKRKGMYCTIWDKVNDIGEIEQGQEIRVMGSYNLLKKGRGLKVEDGYVVEAKKNKLDSYVLVVQQIQDLREGR